MTTEGLGNSSWSPERLAGVHAENWVIKGQAKPSLKAQLDFGDWLKVVFPKPRCWHKLVIPKFRRLRQEGSKFKAKLDYIARSSNKTNKTKQSFPLVLTISTEISPKQVKRECPSC
jgi:hypothetical protein